MSKGANPYVGDILDEVMEKAQAVVVMFSPDDLVQLKGRSRRGGRPAQKSRELVFCGTKPAPRKRSFTSALT
jgi:hypothetical protein